mmetsp:Transcript_22675/g.56921  ORF Transcript_22675/g.56921 Transcript_22675/m.56921 type:complete len:99 (+) Transcript_22675:380-676(+)
MASTVARSTDTLNRGGSVEVIVSKSRKMPPIDHCLSIDSLTFLAATDEVVNLSVSQKALSPSTAAAVGAAAAAAAPQPIEPPNNVAAGSFSPALADEQ